MNKYDAEKFCEYVVYEILEKDGKKEVHYICCCNESSIARGIAKMLALADKKHDSYYVTGVNYPGDLVPGGGWYDCYYTDEEGKLCISSLG